MSLSDDLQLHLVRTHADVNAFFRWLDQPREVLGADTETTGLSAERDRIRLMQFGDEEAGWAIPWEDWRGMVKEVFDGYTGEYVLHNSKFDVRMICNDFKMSVAQWPWHRTHDTMGMAHIIDSQRPKGLKQLAAKYVDARAVQGEQALHNGMRDNKWTWGTVPIDYPPYWQYGALDPVLAVYMYHHFKDEVFKHRELYDLEMSAVRVTAKMEENGIRIDRPYTIGLTNKLMQYAEEARSYLKAQYGIANPTAMQLIKFFAEEGVPLPEKSTPSGRQAMDAEVMDAIDHPVAVMVQAIKRCEKFSHTYLDNFLKMADENDYLHPSIHPMAARTSRMSITEPALQTLPARQGDIIRNAFIPSPGHALISCDYDQIEARLMAHFSQDAGLIAAFNSGTDFFCAIASTTYGYEVTKQMAERDLIKRVVYGKAYGASPEKMAIAGGVPLVQMRTANAGFDKNFPGMKELQNAIIAQGRMRARESADGRGYVVTPYGRVLRCDPGKEYTLINYLIQCHAAEILKHKIGQLDAVLPDEAKLVLPVHDEVIADVPAPMAPELKVLIETTMRDENYLVPITASAEILTETWGTKYRKKAV